MNSLAMPHAMRSVEMIITPEQAKHLLQGNTDNRPRRRGWVDYLAGCIERGEWMLTHQGIALAPNGRLLDGQHRLAAIVKANRPVSMLVTFDAPEATFAALDQLKPRSNADALGMTRAEAAALKLIDRIIEGEWTKNPVLSPAQLARTAEVHLGRVQTVMAEVTAQSWRTQAGVVVAVVARICAGHGGFALPAFKAFANLDFPNLPSSMGALIRARENGNVDTNSNRMELPIKAWMGLDPAREAVTKLTYKDKTISLSEMQAVLKKPVG